MIATTLLVQSYSYTIALHRYIIIPITTIAVGSVYELHKFPWLNNRYFRHEMRWHMALGRYTSLQSFFIHKTSRNNNIRLWIKQITKIIASRVLLSAYYWSTAAHTVTIPGFLQSSFQAQIRSGKQNKEEIMNKKSCLEFFFPDMTLFSAKYSSVYLLHFFILISRIIWIANIWFKFSKWNCLPIDFMFTSLFSSKSLN